MTRALGRVATVVVVASLLGCPPDRAPGWRARDVRHASLLDPALLAQLGSAYGSDRAKAAFVLGQLGVAWEPLPPEVQAEASDRLVARLGIERDNEVRVEIVAALGRVGRDSGRTALLRELETPGPARLRAGWSLCHLYRRLQKELDPTRDLKAIENALVAPEPDVRAALACALAEVKRPSIRPLVRPLLTDGDARVRTFAAAALVTVGDPDDVVVLRHMLDDSDERAAANAALSLAQLAERGQAPALILDVFLQALPQLARPAVVIALANARLLTPALRPMFAQLVDHLEKAARPHLACLAALGHDRIGGLAQLVTTCGGEVVSAGERARLVGRVFSECDPKRDPRALAQLLATPPPKDREARALHASALGRFDDPRTRARLLGLLGDPEPSVWASAAESATLLRATELGPSLLVHLPRATAGQPIAIAGRDIDPLLAVLSAIGALRPAGAAPLVAALTEGTPAPIARAARDAHAALLPGAPKLLARPAIPHGPYDELALPDGAVVVRLETTRGTIRIDVRHDRAPRTARNFVGLVKRGFYDGLTFHRIVPGFVAQGGDPSGDGSGGADHVIACEPNPLGYVEGTVGMALSGLDTGSSQFFIALAPLPRLEGRYTPFAQVVDGMTVVRMLEPGDKILRATIDATR